MISFIVFIILSGLRIKWITAAGITGHARHVTTGADNALLFYLHDSYSGGFIKDSFSCFHIEEFQRLRVFNRIK